MKPKYSSQIFLVLLTVASLACSMTNLPGVQKLQTGPTETFTLHEAYPGTKTVQDVSLSMMLGELTLSGGADALLEGEVRYNVAQWKPMVESKSNSLTVTQGDRNFPVDALPGEDLVNTWDLKLGDVPMNLSVEAGAYESRLDLSGLPLQSLAVQDGASEAEIRFDTLNPEEMKILAYQTGASEVRFLGLANANFTQMSFEGGAGDYTFDFLGDLQRDAGVNLQVGLSSVKIVVPPGTFAQVLVEGTVGDVRLDGAWAWNGNCYENKGSGPQLTIILQMGAGSLSLTNK